MLMLFREFIPGKICLLLIPLREMKPDSKEGDMDEKETKLMEE